MLALAALRGEATTLETLYAHTLGRYAKAWKHSAGDCPLTRLSAHLSMDRCVLIRGPDRVDLAFGDCAGAGIIVHVWTVGNPVEQLQVLRRLEHNIAWLEAHRRP